MVAMGNQWLAIFFGGLKSWRFYVYVFVLTLCFLLFQQGDLRHTIFSSFAYLNGHFVDFYEYNRKYLGRNDYLPLTYIIFAIWNIPLYLLGLVTSPELQQEAWLPVLIGWGKLLPVVFFFAVVKVLAKISEIVTESVNGGN